MLSPASFFDLSAYAFQVLFDNCAYAWEPLKKLKSFMDDFAYPLLDSRLITSGMPLGRTIVLIDSTIMDAEQLTIDFGDATKGKLKVYRDAQLLDGASVIMAGAVLSGQRIHLGKGVLIEPGAFIKAPAIIDDQTEVRQGAYMRGYCLIGKRCVVGHVTEVKHSIFIDDAKAGHFAYLGDSILGNNVNLGAGTKLANLRFASSAVTVRTPKGSVSTGLRKLGAILGDTVQTGCNSVTNPGTLLGKKTLLMPNTTSPSGYHGPNTLIK